eukprot:3111352-Lingulodinium_polyedra.AAC.1
MADGPPSQAAHRPLNSVRRAQQDLQAPVKQRQTTLEWHGVGPSVYVATAQRGRPGRPQEPGQR